MIQKLGDFSEDFVIFFLVWRVSFVIVTSIFNYDTEDYTNFYCEECVFS